MKIDVCHSELSGGLHVETEDLTPDREVNS